jgi:hypothetical protein
VDMWTYKGVDVFPAGPVVSGGLRWYARLHAGSGPPVLRASSKQGMRELITRYLG